MQKIVDMDEHTIFSFLNTKDFNENRCALKMKVVEIFGQEKPGEGTGDKASNYKYVLEECSEGYRIYLKRPAFNYNGFDFAICVEKRDDNSEYEDVNFSDNKPGKRKTSKPSHDDIKNDLLAKQKENKELYDNTVKKFIDKIYYIEEFEIKDVINVQKNFLTGYPLDLVLKIIKWMFIEQDIRYWNYSGRKELYEYLIQENKKGEK